jgi:CheY-like chemotaxis protein
MKVVAGESKTVLVIQPEGAVRRRIREALTPEGHVVLEATDGWGAMWLVESRRQRIDLVIAEAGTPIVGGPMFAQRLQRFGGKPQFLFVAGAPRA